jgi:hypothetical protein
MVIDKSACLRYSVQADFIGNFTGKGEHDRARTRERAAPQAEAEIRDPEAAQQDRQSGGRSKEGKVTLNQ